jgi:hypothetical protein
VLVGVGGTLVGSWVGRTTGWVLVGLTCSVTAAVVVVGLGVTPLLLGKVQPAARMANKMKMDKVRSDGFIYFPSFTFNHIIMMINSINQHSYYDVNYTIVVPGSLDKLLTHTINIMEADR